MCSKLDLIGLVVAHLWTLVPNYRVYLVLPDTHLVLLGSTVVTVLATWTSNEGTCLPVY